jgi:steryl-sulfatase
MVACRCPHKSFLQAGAATLAKYGSLPRWLWWLLCALGLAVCAASVVVVVLINSGSCYLHDQETLVSQPIDLDNLGARLTFRATEYIRAHAAEPFFLYLAFPHTHTALFAHPQFKGRSQHGAYGDNVLDLDWSVGEVLRAIRDAGVWEHTVVAFGSDNGAWREEGVEGGYSGGLRGGKGNNYGMHP